MVLGKDINWRCWLQTIR